MEKEKAKQIIKVLEQWLEKGEKGQLKKYTFSDKIQTEKRIKELKTFL